jgi:hypothetical protein
MAVSEDSSDDSRSEEISEEEKNENQLNFVDKLAELKLQKGNTEGDGV